TVPTTAVPTTAAPTTLAVESVSVFGSDIAEVGETEQYVSTFLPSGAATQADVIWSVVNGTGEATISNLGVLTPVAPGTVTVKATVKGVDGTLAVTLIQSVESVTVAGPDTVELGSDGEYTYQVVPSDSTVSEVVWSVIAGTGSATINSNGILSPVSAGTVTVRVSVDGIFGTKSVQILTPVASVSVQGNQLVRMEDTPTFTASILPVDADYESVVWSVTNGTGSATISEAGILTPTTPGTITVNASANGVQGDLEVELIVSVSGIVVSGNAEVLPAQEYTYVATVSPENAKYPQVTWAVVNGTGSATITAAGVLTGTLAGTVSVTATADGITEEFEVTVLEDDRLLGTPRPTHLLATPENTVALSGEWELQNELEGLAVNYTRQVYDVSFTSEASKSSLGVQFRVPNDVDLSRMQYFAIKVTGATSTEGVNPTVSVQLKDFDSGLLLFNDQVTEIEVINDNQWIVFSIANRYRLQTSSRDLRILLDPHFTASGNEGVLTIQQVVFFGNANPVTSPQLLSGLKNAHWEDTGVTAEPAVDVIGEENVDVLLVSATATAVTNWKAIPSYVLEDISRVTTISFKVKLLTSGLPSDPKLDVYLGETSVGNKTITRPAVGVDPVYQTITITIPANLRTEANMWAAKYIQLKPNAGGNLAVQYYIYDFVLSGDENPVPVTVVRSALGGPDVPFTSAPSYVEASTQVAVAAAGEVPAHRLWTPAVDTSVMKIQYGYTKSSANLAARSGMNGLHITIQGTAGLEINVQQGWADGWADESQRRFILDGTVQHIYIQALTRTLITGGTSGTVAWQLGATIPAGTEGASVKIFSIAFTAIMPIPEDILDEEIPFASFREGTNVMVDVETVPTDAMTVAYHEDGHAIATVAINHANNHLVAIATSDNLRYMNTLTIQAKGAIGTSITIKLAYGNSFNMDTDYVHTFTTNDVETIVIDIQDRDALKVSKISLSLFFNLNEVSAPVAFEILDAAFSGVEIE
ncbi:MAG: Ig-like domain-containing protein, partial [Candidatus Izemoplasmatales bacterium]